MTSWKRKLRFGMVGGGKGSLIGSVHRIAAALDGQAELVAGCFSRDFENTKQTGEELYLDPGRCYKSYEEMAEKEADLPDDKRIDFVSVVTPNKSHFPVSKMFLDAGIHVVCDKPMTFTLEEAQELVSVVEKTGLVFCLTHNYTGYPMARHARHLFKSGVLGQARKVEVRYLQEWMNDLVEQKGNKQAAWRADPNQSGIGGTLGDIGSHSLNLLEFITGETVTEMCADVSTFIKGRKLDDDFNALFRLEGGGKGVFFVSQVAPGEHNGLVIRAYGTKGSIVWRQEKPNDLELAMDGQARRILTKGQTGLSDKAVEAGRIPYGHPEGFFEAFANIYNGAITAIRAHLDGKPLSTDEYSFPTVYDGIRGMEFIYKAVESSKAGAVWVKLP